ncbi:hypothetical protein Trydic_g4684 [Trypoxylus dichotomus]
MTDVQIVNKMDTKNNHATDHSRVIIHIDIDCFYAQVEMIKNPGLRNIPMGVQQKNFVITSNYLARESGIKKCMLIEDALKICPNIVLVNGEDLHDYRQISYKITTHLQKYSSQVERLGLDENFLDVTSLVEAKLKLKSGNINPIGHIYGDNDNDCDCGCHLRLTVGSEIAQEIRESIQNEFQLTCSAGIAHNKLLAKLVGAKYKPNQQTILYPNNTCELLYQLQNVGDIPGIGRTMAETLRNLGLKSVFGEEKANVMQSLCNGIDNTPVKSSGKPISIGLEDSCRNITAIGEVRDKLNQLLNRLMILVSEDGRIPRTIKLTIRKFDSVSKMIKSSSIELQPKSAQRLMSTVMTLFNKLVDVHKPYHITLLGLSFTKFLERMNGKGSITSFFRKNVEVQSITNIENKDDLTTLPMECSTFSHDLSGSESEFEPSPKKTRFSKLIAKRRCFETDDCPSPSKLKVADLHLSSGKHVSSDSSDSKNSFSDDNSNSICCPPNMDAVVFREIPKELQQEFIMSKESSPTAEELKKCLKDAGAFEENMSHDDMLSYYKAIKCSESTAQEEQEYRSGAEDDLKSKNRDSQRDANFSSNVNDSTQSLRPNEKLQMLRQSKAKSSLCKQENLINKTAKYNNTAEFEEYNAFNCPQLKHKPLEIILYQCKYELAPHCNPKYIKLTTSERAKIIRDFHKATIEKFYKFHRESLNPTPWGKPISSSEKFEGTLDRKLLGSDEDHEFTSILEEEEGNNSQEIYTSRSGRQTKRKVYTDLMEEDSEFKKSKKDEDEPFKIEKKTITKRPNLQRLSNQDIIKRSSLFLEPVKKTRTEKMFDELIQNTKKADQQSEGVNDKKIADEADLDIIPNSQDSDEVMEVKPKECTFIPRRIPPPLRGRRGIGSRKQKCTDVAKPNNLLQNSVTSSRLSSVTSSPSTSNGQSQKLTAEETNCPICGESFTQDKIVEHASSCGLLMETESNFDVLLPGTNSKKVNCHVCDKEMLMNTDYEVHVKECIRKSRLAN